MKIHKSIFLLILGFLIINFNSCQEDDNWTPVPPEDQLENRLRELYGSPDVLILPNSVEYNLIDNDPNNPITEAKVELGKMLFHETALGTDPHHEESAGTFSCASCHHFKAGFQSGIKQGIGEGGSGFGINGEGRHFSPDYANEDIDVQPIRSPSILNVAFQDVMLWNGQFGAVGTNAGTEASWTVGTPKETNLLGFEGVETQAIAALTVHRLGVSQELLDSGYKELFDQAFPDIPQEERYTKTTMGMAIAAYERCVLSNKAPFQLWLRGDKSAMDDNELQGANLFFGKANCFTCHGGPGLNNMEFHALGMSDLEGPGIFMEVDAATKNGRGGFTNDPLDNFKFKTPQLYNLADVQFFGHGGSFKSIRDVVAYKNLAIPENPNVPSSFISDKFVPLGLTDEEVDLIAIFLENSLYDPDLGRYVPEALPSGNCFPNADAQSKIDLGCD
ncbi:MAG: cytochrome c peroxidase [Flavobacteriaceae bacterium]|nr:cytochrome c peroxidase [Flavobacteriaceae bacterium]